MSATNNTSIPTGSVSGSSNASVSDGPHTPASPSSPNLAPTQVSTIASANAAALAAKRKPSRRANTAERRATHNAVERQRRETLNGRFLDLAALLPNLSQIRRPSKSAIVNSSIAHIHASRRHRVLASRELRLIKVEADALRRELNEWRDRSGIPRVEEPARGEGFAIVLSGELEVLTLPPGDMDGDMIEMDLEEDGEGQDVVYEDEQVHIQQQQQHQQQQHQQQIHFARLHAQAQQMQGLAPSPSNSTSSAGSYHAPQPHHMVAVPPHHQIPVQRSHTHPMPMAPNAAPPNPRRGSLHLSMPPPHAGHVMIASPTQMSFENPAMGTMSTPTSVGMGMMYDGHVQNLEEKFHPGMYQQQQQQQQIMQQQGMMRGMPMGMTPDQAYFQQVQHKRERSASIGSRSSGSGGAHSPMMGGGSPPMDHSPIGAGAPYENGGWMLPLAAPSAKGPQGAMV